MDVAQAVLSLPPSVAGTQGSKMQDEQVRRDIGMRLKECRRSLKLSQPEVAELLKRSPQVVSKWEHGKSLPAVEDWYAIGKLFGVSLDYLVYGIRTIPVSEYATMVAIFKAPGVEPRGGSFGTPERLPTS